MTGGTVASSASPASALTLGTTAYANDPSAYSCVATYLYIPRSSPTYTATMPQTAAGLLTSWSYDAKAAPAGKQVTLVVLKPSAGGYAVTGVDNETVPQQSTPGLATFTLGTPLVVAPGGAIGLFVPDGTGNCGSFDVARGTDNIAGVPGTAPPTVGTAYTPSTLRGGLGEVNLSAEVTPVSDRALTAAATPSAISVGDLSTLVFPVSDLYGLAATTSFTAVVPAGLHVITAIASGNTCQVGGAMVTCALAWQVGKPPPSVVVVVGADAPGTFAVSGNVAGSASEQTPADNTATAVVSVSAQPAQSAVPATVIPGPVIGAIPVCSTAAVSGLTVSLAKRVLTALHCQPTTGKAKSSKTVKKGLVITTNPGPGKTLASGANVSLTPSSGPAKKKTSKKKKS